MKTYQLRLSSSRGGRILLHLTCIAKHGRWHWHLLGIAREFSFSTASV